MSSKSNVVLGEAPESDSEEEIASSSRRRKEITKQCSGKVIGGEAPESDEESNVDTKSVESISSALSSSSFHSVTGEKKFSTKKNSTLLVRKLRERNASLYTNVREFVGQTLTNANNELNGTNQQLLKCQVQLQEASVSLKTIKSNLGALHFDLQSILTSPFVPEIVLGEKDDKSALASPKVT